MTGILGLVAVRTGSTRLPGKAFLELDGRPLIQVLTERLAASDLLDQFVVCTTTDPADDRIEAFCHERGYRCHRGPVENVLGRFVGASRALPSEFVVRITGDNPLSDLVTMRRCAERLRESGADYSRPDNVPLGTACEVVRAAKLYELEERNLSPDLTEYMTWFFEDAPFIEVDMLPVEPELSAPELRLTVDLDSDLEFMNRLFRHFGGAPSLAEAIAWCRTLEDAPQVTWSDQELAKFAAIRAAIRFS